ncbi:MAG: hypothetical protein VW806_04690 [Halieaceae bacterium]
MSAVKASTTGPLSARLNHRNSPRWVGGFSLASCLIANALGLALIAGLFAATTDLLGAARASSARSDQAMRARQVIRFMEHAMVTARMPTEWLTPLDTLLASQGWHTPSPLCESPEGMQPQLNWGGVDVVAMAELPCVAFTGARWGLYIEQVQVCPTDCGTRSGYVISPVDCGDLNPVIHRETQWLVRWQDNMNQPEHCNRGWPWGRLERLLLSDRNAEAGIEGVPTLRLQSLSARSAYHWQQAETLVANVAGWEPAMLLVPVPSEDLDEVDRAGPRLLSVGFTVIPDQGANALPVLRLRRLLLPQVLSAHG